jgi:hypothetical protein
MLQFHPEEFESMSFNVYPVKEKDITKQMPQIERIDSFKKILAAYKDLGPSIIKYMCYMYDQGSPMKRHFPELSQRKKECANISGVSANHAVEQSLFEMTSPLFLLAIDEFLKFQNHRVWSMIVSNEEVFYEYQSKLLIKTEEDRDKDLLQALQIKSKIMSDMDTINERLESYYDKLYQGDTELIAHVQLKNISPEEIAELDV